VADEKKVVTDDDIHVIAMEFMSGSYLYEWHSASTLLHTHTTTQTLLQYRHSAVQRSAVKRSAVKRVYEYQYLLCSNQETNHVIMHTLFRCAFPHCLAHKQHAQTMLCTNRALIKPTNCIPSMKHGSTKHLHHVHRIVRAAASAQCRLEISAHFLPPSHHPAPPQATTPHLSTLPLPPTTPHTHPSTHLLHRREYAGGDGER
jgi:hypothetical protein